MDGERLQELRKDAGLTQEDLAKELSLSLSSVKAYEQSRSSPDDEIKVKLAKRFNITLDYLLGAIDEEIPLNRTDKIDLPKGFPEESIPKVKEYIRLLMVDYKSKE